MEENNFKTEEDESISISCNNINQITFSNKTGKVIGKLILEGDTISFDGKADESATIFFEYVLKQYKCTN